MKIDNAKIGIWGYGLVGQSAARFLSSMGAFIYIFDDTVKQSDFPPLSSRQELLETTDMILPSPGIDVRPYHALYSGIWLSELDIFHAYFRKKIIAITGSVGKTSVTHGLNFVLQKAGMRTIAAGNIGLPCLSLISHQNEYDAVVLEVSSFQLEHCIQFAPDVAIWTNFYPNHLDRHGTMENYFLAKKKDY